MEAKVEGGETGWKMLWLCLGVIMVTKYVGWK